MRGIDDGFYDVRYNDSTFEPSVDESRIRLAPRGRDAPTGDVIEREARR